MCQHAEPSDPIKQTLSESLEEELRRLREYIYVLESQTEQHKLLTVVMAELTTTLDVETRFRHLAHLLVPHLSDLCVTYMINDDETLQALTLAHAEPALEARVFEEVSLYPILLKGPHPVAEAIRTGTTIRHITVSTELLDVMAINPDHAALLESLGLSSLMSVPLRARGRIIGVLHLMTDGSGRHFSASDQMLAEEIAMRAALVIDNARLYEQEQRHRQWFEQTLNRMVRLQRTTAALSASLDLDAVLRAIGSHAMQVMGASAGAVMVHDGMGHVVTQLEQFGYREEHTQDWQQFSIERKMPATDTLRTGDSVWLPNRAAAQDYPLLLAADPENESWASLPMKRGEQVIGVLGLSFPTAQEFTSADQEFMQLLASQCALALDRAQRYELEQQLRIIAEQAMRERDQVVSLISHDLKSPLAAIQGYTQLLQRRVQKANLPDADSWLRGLSSIALSTTRVSLQLEELLDMASLQTGQALTLNYQQIDLMEIVRRVVDACSILSSEHSIEIDAGVTTLVCNVDSVRIERVLNNLITNAIKYSPLGGVVRVTVGRTTEDPPKAVLQVEDLGMGIPMDELATIFAPFQRASNVRDMISGTGLGLTSARQIVEQHGGAITVESELGSGTTFTMYLPLFPAQPESAGA